MGGCAPGAPSRVGAGTEGAGTAALDGCGTGTRRGRGAGRRVVVSGMGVVCASGLGVDRLWTAARDGVAQIRPLKTERPYDGRIKIAAQVPDFDPKAYIAAELLPYCDPFTQFSIVAADEAVAQAGFTGKDVGGDRTAVIIGTGIGGAKTIDDNAYIEYENKGARGDPLAVAPDLIGRPTQPARSAPTTRT